ncbi:DNA primase large subunit Spp2 [Ophidiomyces ophidiicola]|uniref:DNA primase large subunit Spp2 n=1 Tax=Ophidiomyces ophidiicola TaxID=1387563 RepID=A0ACB8UUH9_9EURO|nr:DNA primase large subunit Spp2 [Ophidiomyces ophidiicola]KAI1925202.1 DNA primase large subunit Spp2 [Ophidiomyces ophidiicola]KAI1939281.1 DNA primase large subunit Spp2 [Ophidiomyces ophidiicola]KAI1950894.1 DNA primase large subunit Spp2 [Ophidiomyces ophidiicola]KAI1965584.1 DNA primase large subunit Spp2 [Ophidiomyces ophidiicola]KAI1972191.1 DNA primase large subunit Spp2 [Ophidiomyces ophidiicola]
MPNPSPPSTKHSTTKPFSIALSSKARTAQRAGASTSSFPLPRGTDLSTSKLQASSCDFHNNDSDSDAEHKESAHVEVSGFDQSSGGAINKYICETKSKEPLVIKVDKRNGWRERLLRSERAKKSWLPEEVKAQKEAQCQGKETAVDVETDRPETKSGLSYASDLGITGHKSNGGNSIDSETQEKSVTRADTEEYSKTRDVSQDEIALQALIRESKGDIEQQSNLIIQSQPRPDAHNEYDETRSFRDDVAHRPDSASLADYTAIPVEQFGAALLRGMGWKEGQPVGRGRYSNTSSSQQKDANLAPRIPERRPGYLGIGAKDISGKSGSAELELGAWGKAAMRKGKPGEGLYTPVLMKSKKTGEMITEEEFKKLTKDQGQSKDLADQDKEWKERRDRNLLKAGRRYDNDNDYREPRKSSSRRSGHGRSRSSSAERDQERRRRRRYDDDIGRSPERKKMDDRYYRDRTSSYGRDTDRRRERDKGRGRDYDQDRSRAIAIDPDRDRVRAKERWR